MMGDIFFLRHTLNVYSSVTKKRKIHILNVYSNVKKKEKKIQILNSTEYVFIPNNHFLRENNLTSKIWWTADEEKTMMDNYNLGRW